MHGYLVCKGRKSDKKEPTEASSAGRCTPAWGKTESAVVGSPHKTPDNPPPLASDRGGTRSISCEFSFLMAMIFCRVCRGHSEPPLALDSDVTADMNRRMDA